MTSLAFAGSGVITVAHGLAVEALDGVSVTAVASRDPAHAAERAGQMGARACTYDQLPAGADVVLVATPPARHAPDTLAALSAGAAVIVEKPLCTTLAEADELVAAEDAGGQIGYAENLVFSPVVRQAVALIGGLGPLHHLEVRSLSNRPGWGTFLDPAWGGGVLFDLGVHPLALALVTAAAAAGDGQDAPTVTSVSARLTSSPDLEVDDDADVDLTFSNGLRARVVASWSRDQPEWDLQAASATGAVRAELLPGLSIDHDGESVELPLVPASMAAPQIEQFGYRAQLEELLADFAAGRTPAMSAAFGRSVLDIVCAAYQSAGQDGAPVAVPFTGPRDRTPRQLWLG